MDARQAGEHGEGEGHEKALGEERAEGLARGLDGRKELEERHAVIRTGPLRIVE